MTVCNKITGQLSCVANMSQVQFTSYGKLCNQTRADNEIHSVPLSSQITLVQTGSTRTMTSVETIIHCPKLIRHADGYQHTRRRLTTEANNQPVSKY